MSHIDVYTESGRRWTFACAVEWPGWSRRGRGEHAALAELAAYRSRYQRAAEVVVGDAAFRVVARLEGGVATDFGAPETRGPWDERDTDALERERLALLLSTCSRTLEQVVAGAPATLRKGPRGGGRDRDQVLEHVRRGQRSYAARVGLKLAADADLGTQTELLTGAVREGLAAGRWPLRYFVRRATWHLLDHAWEIEDKSS